MNTIKKFLAILLAAVMILAGTGCSKTPEKSSYDTTVHGEITLQEMMDNYQSVDPDAMNSQIELLENTIRKTARTKMLKKQW